MISIKDYAKAHGVSYEAVRQQVVRYVDKEVDGFRLADHVNKIGRTQYIDDEGAAFLDERRAQNPIIIQQEQRDETVERLRARVDELQVRLIAAQDEYRALLQDKHEIEMREQALIADKQMIDEIRAETAEAVARAEEAEAAQKKAEEEATGARAQAERQEKAAQEAKAEADRLRASSEQQEKAVRDAKEEADRLREEAELLRTEVTEAEKAAEEAKSRADQMERAGLLARIFRSW